LLLKLQCPHKSRATLYHGGKRLSALSASPMYRLESVSLWTFSRQRGSPAIDAFHRYMLSRDSVHAHRIKKGARKEHLFLIQQ
jgi:hypothetical protein